MTFFHTASELFEAENVWNIDDLSSSQTILWVYVRVNVFQQRLFHNVNMKLFFFQRNGKVDRWNQWNMKIILYEMPNAEYCYPIASHLTTNIFNLFSLTGILNSAFSICISQIMCGLSCSH